MWSVEHLVEYYERLGEQRKVCKKVLKGEQVECPFCKTIIEKTNETIHCPNGCFTRYISPELIALDIYSFDLLYKGKTKLIHAVFKDGHKQFIDYTDDYKDGILTIREDKNRRNETPIYGEPIEINIYDLNSIELPVSIK